MLLVASAAWAQSRNITGIVFDTDGKSPLVGATVILKGTATGTISNADGTYTIHVGSDNDVLVFQSLGYDPQEVTVGSRTTINVTLKESAQKIDEVVVTALGLTRSEKSVGYAVSKVSGDELTKSISSNWVTGLNGKVAGMSMSSAGTGPGGTVRVTLRGDTSLNYGANEALFVIDGIPMSNGTVASGSGANYANSNAPVDFGNPISDLLGGHRPRRYGTCDAARRHVAQLRRQRSAVRHRRYPDEQRHGSLRFGRQLCQQQRPGGLR